MADDTQPTDSTDSTATQAPESNDQAAAAQDAGTQSTGSDTGGGDASNAPTQSTPAPAAEGFGEGQPGGDAPVLSPTAEQPSDQSQPAVADERGADAGEPQADAGGSVAGGAPGQAGPDAAAESDADAPADGQPADPAAEPTDPTVYVPGQATSCNLDDDNAVIVQMRAGDVCSLLQRIERKLPTDTDSPANDDERRTVRLCNVLRAAIGYGPVDHPMV